MVGIGTLCRLVAELEKQDGVKCAIAVVHEDKQLVAFVASSHRGVLMTRRS